METGFIIVIAAVCVLAALVVLLLLRGEQVMGRLSHLAESETATQVGLNDRLIAQERVLTELLRNRLDDVSKRVTEGLVKTTDRTTESLTQIQKRLAVIDNAQKNISELSTQMVGLQDILANKQARGAFGEIQLNDLVSAVLPPGAYAFQASLSNGRRADCLLKLPNPPGSIVIDAKFPLESYNALQNAPDDAAKAAAGRAFAADVTKHVNDIAARYIIPGETAEQALMFIPSESVFATLHADFRSAVEHGFRKRVWIVSPSTCMAMLHTVRAVLRDVRMREQAHVIQKEVGVLAEDVSRLDARVENLRKHFNLAEKDIGEIQTSARKITSRADKIGEIEMAEDDAEAALAPPQTPPETPPETPKPRLVSSGED
ncbi:MAG: DNA recombination protein RmuC, partial [Rhodospirillales bacterium]|nr:DNA recombination protein RmuC [Rhodospirillales bacterium]